MGTNAKIVACAIIKDEPKFGETLANLKICLGKALAGVVIHETSETPLGELGADVLADDWGQGPLLRINHRPFDDFSSARNACLDDAQRCAREVGASWVLMFSAGAEFSGKFVAPRKIGVGMLAHTERCGESEFLKAGPIHVRSTARYVGKTHESLDAGCDLSEVPHCGLTVDYSRDFDPEKKARRCLLDIRLLQDDYSPRGRFYLAQSFDVLKAYNEAFGYYAFRLSQQGFELERLQAVCGAVKTAPTIQLARWAAQHGADCADVQLSLAEREIAAQNTSEAQRAVILASLLEKRSMFKNTRLAERCAEITEMCK